MAHSHSYIRDFHQHNITQVLLWNQVLQVLATSLSYMRRVVVRVPPWAFPYTLISCTNASKKRLNVMSLASLPVAFCQASRAFDTL